MLAPGPSATATGSAPCSVTFTGSMRSVAKPGFFRTSAYSPTDMPWIANAPSAPVFVFGRELCPPRRTKFIMAPPAPLRMFMDGSTWTSTSASGWSLASFTKPVIVAPRFRTTVTPAFVPPAGSARPATVARS